MEGREHAVLALGVVLLLAASIASLPFWSYSRDWGFVPSATATILLFFAALLAVGGKPAQSETVQTAEAPAPAKPSGYILDSSRQPIPLQRASAVTAVQ
ncbi:MAG: DUF3309 domain-containing protein [Alphaproteobacteria bacterium]|nr:DUF3309 domain-containing protein [Alphaproteobacteria bacterium]